MIDYILEKLIMHNVITFTEKEIYRYGIFVILFNSLILISFILVGLTLKKVYNVILFLIFFIPIRVMLGGYHCKKPLNCFLVSNLFLLSVILLIPYFKKALTIFTFAFMIILLLQKDKIPFYKYLICIALIFYILGITHFQMQPYINLSFLTNIVLYCIPFFVKKKDLY